MRTSPIGPARSALLALALLAAPVTPSRAQGVTGLYNTGVDAGKVKETVGSTDAHYTVLENAGSQAIVTNNGAYVQDANSAYIWQQADGNPGNTTRTFRTTFTVASGYDPLTAFLTGQWSTDAPRDYLFPHFDRRSLSNGVRILVAPVAKLPLVSVLALVEAGASVEPAGNFGVDILINGVSTGNQSFGFGSFTNFAVNTGFVSGLNTLDFVVTDFGPPGALDVRALEGNASLISSATPEPASLALLATGLIGVGLLRRRTA